MNSRLFSFIGSSAGDWVVNGHTTVAGESLDNVTHVSVLPAAGLRQDAQWILRGVTSNERYVERSEKQQLLATQAGLGRPEAMHAALIPIRKNAAWWALTQDERRAIFEAQSRHIAIGMRYLPAIACKLHHCRDLEGGAPFDFLTWFEYAPEHESLFDAMLAELRDSPEWCYVDRETDIRLQRAG